MKNLFLIIGILIISAAVASSFFFYKQKQQETEKLTLLKKEIEKISFERVEIAQKIKQLKEEKAKLQDGLENVGLKKQKLDSDLQEAIQTRGSLRKELSEKERDFLSLNERLTSLVNEESQLNAQLEEAKRDYEKASQEIEAVSREKAALEENIKTRLSAPGGVELKKIVVKIAPPVEGRVIEVNKEYSFAIVNLGLKDNIKSGDVFGIYRRSEFLAKAVAENIYEDMSSIIVLDEWSDVQVLANDTVKLLRP